MLQGYFLARDHFYICDKFTHGPTEKDDVYLCVAMFPDLYVMRWLSPFLKHVFPRSRLNARTYSRVLSPSTSGSGLPYPIPPCTSLYSVPARPTWAFQSPHGDNHLNNYLKKILVFVYYGSSVYNQPKNTFILKMWTSLLLTTLNFLLKVRAQLFKTKDVVS